MKVLFVFGGIPLYMDRLLETLVSKGADITVLIPAEKSITFGKNIKTSDGEKSYKVIRAEEKRSRLSGKAYFPALKNILSEEAPDILVIGWPYFLQLFFDRGILRIIRRKGIKLMLREIPFQVPPFMKAKAYFREHPAYDEAMTLRSKGARFLVKNTMIMFIRRFLYKRADAALCYATTGYDVLPGYGMPREKIFVTYNSTDTAALYDTFGKVRSSPPLLPANKHRILHIGRLVKWKRVDLLIEAFAGLAPIFPDAELVIAGDGPELEYLKEQAKKAGVEGRTLFAGAVYDPFELGRYMHESSVYVLAGMGGLSINDAMTYGLPVVCSVCDGTEKDLVTDGFNGYFFKDGDSASLTEKLTAILSSDKLRKAMSEASMEIIREKINMDTVSGRYMDAFKSVSR